MRVPHAPAQYVTTTTLIHRCAAALLTATRTCLKAPRLDWLEGESSPITFEAGLAKLLDPGLLTKPLTSLCF